MTKQKEHIALTNKNEEWDDPIYYSEKVIPEKFANKTIIFKNTELSIRFVHLNNQMVSLPYAPWGSFSFLDKVEESSFKTLIREIRENARTKAISTIVIKDAPGLYRQTLPTKWFLSSGFNVKKEINQHLSLENKAELHKMEKRKLKKWSQNLKILQLLDISKAYQLLHDWRISSNIPLNIEKAHLQMLFNKLPDRYDCWIALHVNEIIAVCITIKVTSDVVYYFLPATSPKHKTSSPMVFLIEEMSKIYKSEGFKTFDLGQSSIEGKKQEGLFRFKERMGAQKSDKLIYELTV